VIKKDGNHMQISNTGSSKLSVQQAAKLLSVSTSWLNKARLVGNGPQFMKLGRRVLYDTADIESWLSSRKFCSTSAYSTE
jgi:predicted DNA-binding transcriptional regulator AlpA